MKAWHFTFLCGISLAGLCSTTFAGLATIYYFLPSKNWTTVYIHHSARGDWTQTPGEPMAASCPSWASKTVDFGSKSDFEAVFANGTGAWDNKDNRPGGNYLIRGGVHQLKDGQLLLDAGNPCGGSDHKTATVFYKPNPSWTTVNIHYEPQGGRWTTPPGVSMDAACTGWRKKIIALGAGTGLTVTFNNGSEWDNNGGRNYQLGTGPVQVADGVIASGDPCGSGDDKTPPSVPTGLSKVTATASSIHFSWRPSIDNVGVTTYEVYRDGSRVGTPTDAQYADSGLKAGTIYRYTVKARDGAGNVSAASAVLTVSTEGGAENKAEVYFYTKTRAWTEAYMHYAPNGGTWTVAPGTLMNEVACADWVRKTVNLGGATGLKAAFNNGSSWDNNNGKDYVIGVGRSTVKDGVLTANASVPCKPQEPDTQAPSVPAGLTASAFNLSVDLDWIASSDNRGVTGYEIRRTGGSQGPKAFSSSVIGLNDGNLDPHTQYSYAVRAFDAAGNKSDFSSPVSVKTGDKPPPPKGGGPLGGDIREDSIYFVMTARFYDGDVSNNRGGNQHEKSGNARYNDPMFRGDFKGLIQKLDYIKALGFSAIWITPVVLNRSDYDFHGYHGWDFYRVDPRLESPGASYQDLINAAHAKGIKIIQDVVYNHSSRWGAKGLFTPKVFGIRDSQWSWYYDQPNPNFSYNGLAIEPISGKSHYTGDLWSTAEPAGNSCRNWGVPNGFYSKEGYKVYNCQWPNPTSSMFPPQYYHQCWLGNWEGEDSRSCWIHEDLADFNTESKSVQDFLIQAYNRYIDMGVDGFRLDTVVHIPRLTWNRHFLPAAKNHARSKFGEKGAEFFIFGEVAAFVHDKWNRGSVNHSAQFFTWKERKEYPGEESKAVLDQYEYEQNLGPGSQPTSTNAFLRGNTYHVPDHSRFSGMSVIDMRMHMNFGEAGNAFNNGRDSDDSYNDATYNVVYVDSHDYGPNKSGTRYDGGTAAWAENMSLMWTFRGIPTLFYGSEIEFQAGKPIDCGPTCPLSTTGRAYFGDKIDGTVTTRDFGVVDSASGAVAATLNYPLVKHVQRLNQIRRGIPALQKGQYSTEGVTGGIAFKRRFTDSAKGVDSFAVVAVSSSATFRGIPNGVYKDAVTGDVKTVSSGTLEVSVVGKGNARVYVLDLPGNPAPGRIGADGPYLKP